MDIAAWQTLHRQDPAHAAATFHDRVSHLPAVQQRAIWAWIAPADAKTWTAIDPVAPLAGVPYAIKDLFQLAGVPTLGGGRLPAKPARASGAIVNALGKLGAIPAGKTHLHEYAYGLTGENPHFGDVPHPRFADRTSGGSSSGSAAAVAAGIVPFALGTDTGGSLRVPAAFCGIYSWRHTPHHAWIADAFPLAPSFDTAGWLAQTPTDMRLLHRLLVSDNDRETVPPSSPRGAYLSAESLGVEISPAYAEKLATVAGHFTDRPVPPTAPLPTSFRGSTLAYSILQSTEAFAIHQSTLDSQRPLYGEAVWQRIDRGRRWTAAQLHRAHVTALHVRLGFSAYFEHHDFLIMPVAPSPALLREECDQPHRDALLSLTTPCSLAGLPALTVPISLPDGLSLGLQFIFPSAQSPAINWVLNRCENC